VKVATIGERLDVLRQRIAAACQRAGRSPDEVTLVAISKGQPAAAIAEALAASIRHIGENRVQEAAAKRPALADIWPSPTWHLVGHLQSNKVKLALDLFDIIHSVDSLPLADLISKRAQRPVPVLLEVNVAGEASKFGFSAQELAEVATMIARLPNLKVRGLMTVAPLASDPEQVRPVFRRLWEMRDSLDLPDCHDLSMGMTDDFEVAIEEGSTIVRIGRAIFGERAT